MERDVSRLRAITNARDRLRRVAFASGQARGPREISFSQAWLQDFQSLNDAELVCPTSMRATGGRFWGVPLHLRDLGDMALLTFVDNSYETVQLELPEPR